MSRSQSVATACQVIAESPVKSKRGRSDRNFCAVCLGEIVDGKHEAIFCEGRCNMWYHRGCASVSQQLLRELTASEEPFLCLMCSRTAFKEEISLLKAEIAFLKSELKLIPAIKTSIEALHREVSDLQSKTNISANASGDSAAVTVPTYARVASNRNVLHQKQQPHSRRKRVADKPVNASSANTTGSDNRNHNRTKQERVAVLGVRRIWGTLKHTSTTSVSSTLNKLTTLGNY